MKNKKRNKNVISTSLSPNTEKDDALLALKTIFNPFNWKKGDSNQLLEEKIKDYLKVGHTFLFNSGRSSFLAILDALEIKEGDEFILQGFTCNSAVIPIIEKGAKPVFVDIDNSLNIDPDDLIKKITSNTKAIMVQHTFGCPAQMDKIMKIAKEKDLFVIEDCAHSLGASYKGRKCGTFGDVAFFSFGRDKIISSVFGGAAVTNNIAIALKIDKFRKGISCPSGFWIFQQLLHPILMRYLIIPFYNFPTFGRILLGGLQRIRILSKAVYKKEKQEGKMPNYFPKKMPNAFSILALNQFDKLERFNSHRKEIADLYTRELKNNNVFLVEQNSQGSIFMRFSILVNNSDKIIEEARKEKIFLNDGWRKSPIVPPDTNLEKVKYSIGSCQKAEEISERILNLPTHINISREEAYRIVKFIKNNEY